MWKYKSVEKHSMLKQKMMTSRSKPTLVEHLNNLVKNGLVKREEEDKQKVSYELNWNDLKQLNEANQISAQTQNPYLTGVLKSNRHLT